MIYPIVAYGDPVLKKEAADIDKETFEELDQLIDDMFETMYNANGVGLAAPQIGKSIRLFVVDGEPMDEEDLQGFKKVFINPEIIEEYGDDWPFEEGCLSIPHIRESVDRAETLKIKYFDRNWNEQIEEYSGIAARIIQHEYDHIEGILFTDHLSNLKKRLIKKKLVAISKGQIDVSYRMRYPLKK